MFLSLYTLPALLCGYIHHTPKVNNIFSQQGKTDLLNADKQKYQELPLKQICTLLKCNRLFRLFCPFTIEIAHNAFSR